jgi:hypothetical protein
MQIIKITASATAEGHEQWGLGDDQKVYRWYWREGKWVLYQYDPKIN